MSTSYTGYTDYCGHLSGAPGAEQDSHGGSVGRGDDEPPETD